MKVSDWVKQLMADDAIFYGLLITLVALTAYGLGKHSVTIPRTDLGEAPVALVREAVMSGEVAANEERETAAFQVVASKNGTKYHFLWCPGASQMKEENKVYFDSIAAARAAGYEPAANCEGLE